MNKEWEIPVKTVPNIISNSISLIWKVGFCKNKKGNVGMKTQLDSLVTAGTITSDQETAIQSALTPSK